MAMRLRWIVISYFMIGGGVALALGTLAFAWVQTGSISPATIIEILTRAAHDGIEPRDVGFSFINLELALALVYGSGAALGGFFTARASPHRSLVEPAIGAVLVVGSFLAVIYSTPMGKILISFSGDHLERLASLLAASGIVLGLVGAALGELASPQSPRLGILRRTGIGILIALGALWTSTILFGLVFANEVGEKALANWTNSDASTVIVVSNGRILSFVMGAAISAAVAAGICSQLCSSVRSAWPATISVFVVFAALPLPLLYVHQVPHFPQVQMDHLLVLSAIGGGSAGIVAGAAAWLTGFFVPRNHRS